MSKRRCKCGHVALKHQGSATECLGRVRTGKNEVGAKQVRFCECATYRPTSLPWWKVLAFGTEGPEREGRREGFRP